MSATKAFFYILLRDHLAAGIVEKIFDGHVDKLGGKSIIYSNQHLAAYAEELAKRLVATEGCTRPCVMCDGYGRIREDVGSNVQDPDYKDCNYCGGKGSYEG